MRGTEYKSRDKKVQKMTRDGLIEQNLTEGTQQRVSLRPQEVSFSKSPTASSKSKTAASADSKVKKSQRTKQAVKMFQQQSSRTSQTRIESPAGYDVRSTDTTEAARVKRARRKRKRAKTKADNTQQKQISSVHRTQTDSAHQSQKSNPQSLQADKSDSEQESFRRPKQFGNKTSVLTEADRLESLQSARSSRDTNFAAVTSDRTDKVSQLKDGKSKLSRTRSKSGIKKPDLSRTGQADKSIEDKPSRLQYDRSKVRPTKERKKMSEPVSRYFTRDYSKAQLKKTSKQFRQDEAKVDVLKTSRLQFSKGEQLPVKQPPTKDADSSRTTGNTIKSSQQNKLSKLQRKAGKYDAKLSAAQEKPPTYKVLRYTRDFDKDTGETNGRLRFEKEAKPLKRYTLLDRSAKLIFDAATRPNRRDENGSKDDTGVEATDETIRTARSVNSRVKNILYRKRARAYRKVAKLERKATKAHVKHLYKKALVENPASAKSNPVNKFLQKRAIKRRYAQALRASKTGAAAAQQTGNIITKTVRFAFNAVFKNKTILGTIIGLLMVYLAGSMLFASCSAMLSSVSSIIFVSTYWAEDNEIHDSDLQWTEMEQDLRERIDNIETEYPDYDEYRYNVDVEEINHDPFELIAFLSSIYYDFRHADISSVLTDIFDQQYNLILEEETETRYRTETYIDDYGDEQTEEVPYEYRILNITLESVTFMDVITPILEENDALDQFNTYMESMGNHQILGSPFAAGWLNNVSSLYGYRQNPTGPGTQFHKGIDIALPGGTPIQSVQDGRVVTAAISDTGYGNHVVIENDAGVQSMYAHCSDLIVSVGQMVSKGDIIGTVGTTGNSTGNHLHIEILINGQNLNPLFLLASGG